VQYCEYDITAVFGDQCLLRTADVYATKSVEFRRMGVERLCEIPRHKNTQVDATTSAVKNSTFTMIWKRLISSIFPRATAAILRLSLKDDCNSETVAEVTRRRGEQSAITLPLTAMLMRREWDEAILWGGGQVEAGILSSVAAASHVTLVLSAPTSFRNGDGDKKTSTKAVSHCLRHDLRVGPTTYVSISLMGN